MVLCPVVVVGKVSESGNVALRSCRSIKLLLLHLVSLYITLPTLMMHGQTQIKKSLLYIIAFIYKMCDECKLNGI